MLSTIVASGLARARLRSSRKSDTLSYLMYRNHWFWGRFAARRGQARSPQVAAAAFSTVGTVAVVFSSVPTPPKTAQHLQKTAFQSLAQALLNRFKGPGACLWLPA
jgi:hypothetical protein